MAVNCVSAGLLACRRRDAPPHLHIVGSGRLGQSGGRCRMLLAVYLQNKRDEEEQN